MSIVFRGSLKGHDVNKASVENLAFLEELPNMKIKTNQDPPHFATINFISEGTVSYPAGKTVLWSIEHKLGYRPRIFFIYKANAGNDYGTNFISRLGLGSYLFEADDEKLYFILTKGGSGKMPIESFVLKYYLIADEG